MKPEEVVGGLGNLFGLAVGGAAETMGEAKLAPTVPMPRKNCRRVIMLEPLGFFGRLIKSSPGSKNVVQCRLVGAG